MPNILTLETNKYAIKIENFEGPLDLLCHLIDKNKMNINDIKLSEITDQYIEYINKMEEMNLEVTSEFLVMASTLIYLKSKSLLPSDNEESEEISEEELLRRIIEYKKYKEITKTLKSMYEENSVRFYKTPDEIKLPKQKLERDYDKQLIIDAYSNVVRVNQEKVNQNASNIEKIAITDKYTVPSKVKEMLRELVNRPKFVFNALFSLKKCEKEEVVTAFSGLLELSRRSKVITSQENLFGDISVENVRDNGAGVDNTKLGGAGEIVTKQLEKLSGFEARCTVLGYMQRGGTPTAFDRVLSTKYGAKAMELAMEGKFGTIAVIKNGKLDYATLEDVVGQNKEIGAVSGNTPTSNIRKIKMDDDLVKTARDIGICLGD